MLKHMKLFRFSIVIFFVSVLAACDSNDFPSGLRAFGQKFPNERDMNSFIDHLEQESIPFKIDDDGFVVFLNKDEAKVLGIIREIRYGTTLESTIFESLPLTSETEKKMYIDEFERKGIYYIIRSNGNTTSIVWSQKDGPEVDIIRQQLNKKMFERYLDKRKQ